MHKKQQTLFRFQFDCFLVHLVNVSVLIQGFVLLRLSNDNVYLETQLSFKAIVSKLICINAFSFAGTSVLFSEQNIYIGLHKRMSYSLIL